MNVIHLKDVEAKENSGSLFTAPVGMKPIESPGKDSPMVSYVIFPKGVRNKLHTHDHDQILVVTEGKGILANESEKQEISVGDVAVIPAGEKHWHGAADDSGMTHIAIMAAGTSVDQLEA